MGQQADFHFFLQIGVDDFFLFLGLQGLKQQLAGFGLDVDGAAGFAAEVLLTNLAAVDQAQCHAIYPPGAEFFQ